MPRLFETSADNDPNLANRIAFGRPGIASLYMTFANLLTWLQNNLTFPSSPLTVVKLDSGDWNMDTTPSINVAHGVADWTKIVSAKILIYADTDNGLYPLSQDLLAAHDPISPGTASISGSYAINATNIVCNRLTGGWYDQGGWDNTSYNRAKIILEVEP